MWKDFREIPQDVGAEKVEKFFGGNGGDVDRPAAPVVNWVRQEVAKMTDAEMLEQFQMLTETVSRMIDASEHRMKVYMENQIGKRIDSLFDGYKLTHEKQWELERETEKLKEQVSDL